MRVGAECTSAIGTLVGRNPCGRHFDTRLLHVSRQEASFPDLLTAAADLFPSAEPRRAAGRTQLFELFFKELPL